MDDRGVSDVIGFILVFSLVASTVAIISLSGFDSLQGVRDSEQTNNVERAFDVLADNMGDIHREGAPSRATEINLNDAQLSTTETVTVNLTWEEKSSRDRIDVMKTTVAPIVWSGRDGNTEIVYSLGAVIRDERQGGIMASEPPFVLDEDRMLIPIVRTVTNNPKSYGGTTARVVGLKTRSEDRRNITDVSNYNHLWFNITTPRAQIWQRYLERQDSTTCSLYNQGRKVGCRLTPNDEPYISLHGIEVAIEG